MVALAHFLFGRAIIRLMQRYLALRGFLHDEVLEQQAVNGHIHSLGVFLASALLQEYDTWRFVMGLRYTTEACGSPLLGMLWRSYCILKDGGMRLILQHLLSSQVIPGRDGCVSQQTYSGNEDRQVERSQGTRKVSEKRRLYKRAYNKRLRASKRAARSGHEHTTDANPISTRG